MRKNQPLALHWILVFAVVAMAMAFLLFGFFGCRQPVNPNPPTNPPVDDTMTQEEEDLFKAHNDTRALYGARPLAISLELSRAARGHAKWMADHNRMSHTGANGSTLGTRLKDAGYAYGAAGENIAAGYNSVPSVMDGWIDSPGHRANMLKDSFEHVGLAVAVSSSGQKYWCVNFGRPLAQGAQIRSIPQSNLPEGVQGPEGPE